MNSKMKQFVFAMLAFIGVVVIWYLDFQTMLVPGGFTLSDFISENYVKAVSTRTKACNN